jgi:hypothetical protein
MGETQWWLEDRENETFGSKHGGTYFKKVTGLVIEAKSYLY